VTAAAPRKLRDRASQFTILLEHGCEITADKLGLVLRAVQFFILSMPDNCLFNFQTFGQSSINHFGQPELLNAERRRLALAVAKGVDPDSPPQRGDPFRRVARAPGDAEAVVVLIASALPADVRPAGGDVYFFLDPFSRGDLRATARRAGAVSVPTASEAHLASALLSVLKMTAAARYSDFRIAVDGRPYLLPLRRPGELVSCLTAADGAVERVELAVEQLVMDVPIVEAELPIVDQLWAYERLVVEGAEDADAAARILTPADDAVATIARDDDVDVDVAHIEAQLGHHGVGWIAERPAPVAPPVAPLPRGRMLPQPFAGPARVLAPAAVAGTPVVVTENRMFVGRMPGSTRPIAPPQAQAAPVKPSLFLLRLLESQEMDGSWRQESSLKISCGFAIPPDSLGIDRVSFLTAFVIVCLRVGAPNS
jgi:hypothetical protein